MSHRSREVHDSCHVLVQGPETAFKSFKCCSRLTVVKLGCRVRKVYIALRVVMVLGTGANNVGI